MAKTRTPQAQALPDGAFEMVTQSVDETQAFGEALGRLLSPGDTVAFFGELGAGKTTFIQGIARGLGRDAGQVKSPTFVLMREYRGEPGIVHIDGYRLEGAPAVAWLDVDLIFSPHKITLIEWAERFQGLLPESYLEVRLAHAGAHARRLACVPVGARGAALTAALKASVPAPAIMTGGPEPAPAAVQPEAAAAPEAAPAPEAQDAHESSDAV